MKSWFALARQRKVMLRALKTSILVGTILVLINQGGRLLEGSISALVIAKIILTYLVPYAVATHASVAAIQDSRVD